MLGGSGVPDPNDLRDPPPLQRAIQKIPARRTQKTKPGFVIQHPMEVAFQITAIKSVSVSVAVEGTWPPFQASRRITRLVRVAQAA